MFKFLTSPFHALFGCSKGKRQRMRRNENAKDPAFIVPTELHGVDKPGEGNNSYNASYGSSQGTERRTPKK